jgi:hypothetical protein
MDVAAVAAALVGARMGQVQMEAAAKMMRMNADAAASILQVIDAAQQNIDRLANVAAGIGTNLDITA